MDDILKLIKKIGTQESSLIGQTFVSPVFNTFEVITKISGIIYPFQIPKTANGWFCFKAVSTKKAIVDRVADLPEIERYLKYLPRIRVVLVLRKDNLWYGIPDKANVYGLQFGELYPIYLHDDTVESFDRINTRFDGANLWFDGVDYNNEPSKSQYLRDCMQNLTQPEKIQYAGLTKEEKHAYAIRMTVDKKLVADQQKEILKSDVEFAGGKFVGFDEKKEFFVVTYTVHGEKFVSRINKNDHRVISAGLCLSGGDAKFDLKSLVTVIREGQNTRRINNYRGHFPDGDHGDRDEYGYRAADYDEEG